MHVTVAQINLAGNNLCGIYTDSYGRIRGTYTAEGIKAIADSIAVTASLTYLWYVADSNHICMDPLLMLLMLRIFLTAPCACS